MYFQFFNNNNIQVYGFDGNDEDDGIIDYNSDEIILKIQKQNQKQ